MFDEAKNPYVRKRGLLGGATFKNSKQAASPHPHAPLGCFYLSDSASIILPSRLYSLLNTYEPPLLFTVY